MKPLSERLETLARSYVSQGADRKEAIVVMFNSSAEIASFMRCTAEDVEQWCVDQIGQLPIILDAANAASDLLARHGERLSEKNRQVLEQFLTAQADLLKRLTPNGAPS